MPTTTTIPTITVSTPFGPVLVHVTGENTVTVEAGNRINEAFASEPLRINRVEIGIRTTLEFGNEHRATLGDTGWSIDHQTVRVDPSNWRRMNEYPSDSCRAKLRQVYEAVAKRMNESGEVLAEAGDQQRLRAIERIEAQIQTKFEEIRVLQAERAALAD